MTKMKKILMVTAAVLSMAVSAHAADMGPKGLGEANQHLQAASTRAELLGLQAALLPVMAVVVPINLLSVPSQFLEAGDAYAQTIPGTAGRWAARTSLAPLRLAFAIPALPSAAAAWAAAELGFGF